MEVWEDLDVHASYDALLPFSRVRHALMSVYHACSRGGLQTSTFSETSCLLSPSPQQPIRRLPSGCRWPRRWSHPRCWSRTPSNDPLSCAHSLSIAHYHQTPDGCLHSPLLLRRCSRQSARRDLLWKTLKDSRSGIGIACACFVPAD
jgi:hypothetical protein